MRKKIGTILVLAFLIPIVLVLGANYTIEKNAKHKTFSDASKIQENNVGLVLGTSKYLSNGRINLYFKYRIDATVELFTKGKIDFILVSGDNGNKHYDEPSDFKNELVLQGIPEHKIFLDYAGFRTLDSMVRAKAIFGLDSITVISQRFHNERAIYLAEQHGLAAVGYNAKDLSGNYGLKTQIREYFARTKAIVDILFKVQPKFLGKTVEIP